MLELSHQLHGFYASIQPLILLSWEMSRCIGCYMQIITAWKSSGFLYLPVESWVDFHWHHTAFGFSSLHFCTDQGALLPYLWALGTRNHCHTGTRHSPLCQGMAPAGTSLWSHSRYGSAALGTQAKSKRDSWLLLLSSEDKVENTCKH